jgi:RNA-directed DNA polymerase
LVGWACQKYKRLRRREKRAGELLAGTARRYPNMFAHWRFGLNLDPPVGDGPWEGLTQRGAR